MDNEKEDVSIVSPYIILCTGKKKFRVFGLGYSIKLYLLQIEVRILEESQKDKDKVEAGQHSEEKKADKEKQDVSIVSPWHISYYA